jgi:hypothetical protein
MLVVSVGRRAQRRMMQSKARTQFYEVPGEFVVNTAVHLNDPHGLDKDRKERRV